MAIKRSPMTPGSAKPGAPGVKLIKPKKPKKPLPRFLLVLITVFVFLLLIAGAGFCLYTNVGGLADRAMALFPQYRVSMADLDKQKADLADKQAKLKTDQAKLAEDLKAAAEKSADLLAREQKLAADRKAFEDSKAVVPDTAAEDRQKAVADIYQNLEASDAAEMLIKAPTLREAADILALLPVEKASEIIAAVKAIDAEKAYDLTKLIGQ